jgi:hypothetical protein
VDNVVIWRGYVKAFKAVGHLGPRITFSVVKAKLKVPRFKVVPESMIMTTEAKVSWPSIWAPFTEIPVKLKNHQNTVDSQGATSGM